MFALDTKAAKAGSGGSSRIDTTGKYKGEIKFAKYHQSDSGSNFVTFMFKSDDGQDARISICTHGKNGQETYGYKQVQAVMACAKVRNLTLENRVVDDWVPEAKEVQQVQRQVFKELNGAKIGLALYRHDQTGQNGDFYSMEIAAPFEYSTELTAIEILDKKTEPLLLGKIVANLKDKDSRNKSQSPYSGSVGQASYGMQAPVGSDFEDDIPF